MAESKDTRIATRSQSGTALERDRRSKSPQGADTHHPPRTPADATGINPQDRRPVDSKSVYMMPA